MLKGIARYRSGICDAAAHMRFKASRMYTMHTESHVQRMDTAGGVRGGGGNDVSQRNVLEIASDISPLAVVREGSGSHCSCRMI